MNKFLKVFGRQLGPVIGMVHVRALPGSPRSSLTMDEIVSVACEEARTYERAKLDGIMIENMHDVPWLRPEEFGAETIASMAIVASAIRREFPSIPIGIQVLSSGNKQALGIAKVAGLNFIRAEGWVFAHIGDEGYTESCAAAITRYRRHLLAEDILIFTDVKKKHSSHAVTSDVSIATSAEAAELFCSDGIVVTGASTGTAASLEDLRDVQVTVSIPVLVGSGVTLENVDKYHSANGLIIGSHFKQNGHWANDIDLTRVEKFMDCVNRWRQLNK